MYPEDGTEEEEPVEPAKKRHKKGQNRSRPRGTRTPFSQKLCPNLKVGEACQFKEECRFSHDVAEFMKLKPPDLGDNCVFFEQFGKCPHGLTCRFGSKHISEDYRNIVNMDIYDSNQTLHTKNSITKEFQESLRKRSVIFSKSDEYFKALERERKSCVQDTHQKTVSNDLESSNPLPSNSGLCASKEALNDKVEVCSKESQCSPRPHPQVNGDVIINTLSPPSLSSKPSSVQIDDTHSDETAVRLNSQPLRETGTILEGVHQPDMLTPATPTSGGSLQESTSFPITPEPIRKKVDFKNKLYLAPLTTVSHVTLLVKLYIRMYR